MAETTPRWTAEQIAKAEGWLRSKWGEGKACYQCGNTFWLVGPNAAVVGITSPDGRTTHVGAGYPCVAVICVNCGNTVLVNSLIAGLQEPQQAEESSNG